MGKAFLIGIVVLVVISVWDSSQPLFFSQNLGYGDSNDRDVLELQRFLTEEGLYEGPVTGNYLDQTAAAVQAFQAREGIEMTGYFGPLSRAAANSDLPRAMTPGMMLFLGLAALAIMGIATAKRKAPASGSRSSASSYDSDSERSSYPESGKAADTSDSWGGHPALGKGASSARGRADGFGSTWFTDDKGNTARERTDDLGYRSFSGDSGNVMQEKEGSFGGTYFSDGEGTTMQSRTDDVGNTYYKDNHGNVVREREDGFGNKTYTRE